MATDTHRSRPLRFGLTTAMPRRAAESRDFAQAVEAAGFDVLTFPDHLVPSAPPFAGATAAALATDRMHVGTLVLNNDFRHPVDTARETAGVATLTEGRFELGIGAGHMKTEYDAAGIPFDGGGVRVSRLEESARRSDPCSTVRQSISTARTTASTPRPAPCWRLRGNAYQC